MFTEALEDILRDHCTPAVVRAIEAGGQPGALWSAIADAGFLELLAPEDAGGAGLTLAEAFPVFALLGRYAVPLPVGQAIVARALLPAGAVPAGIVTLAPALRHTAGGWQAPLVPHGLQAGHVLADDGESLWLFDAAQARREATGIHHDTRAHLHWPAGAQPQRFERPGDACTAFGAALHAALLAGALSRTFEITLAYGNDRTQFGRSIGKFQAIQHQLSIMAEHVAAARMAAESAFAHRLNAPALLSAAVAKARASEAVVLAASIAHAVHGAIGVTEEYDLQLYTRRLHEWRMAHGSESHWHPLIGRAVLAEGLPTLTEFVRTLQEH
ncbi:acyl-CoA/acyl-ACP dehydrogenase [Ramlibacter sp. H39-3-26]|uniref:acyl-CoA dehydrogenase family protein n=1 Tax=Curvibacter soli TaxID=3031331 RepID=UPI0023DB180F|nr:acyl-CoA dehydrogenase family protein [Ramlibacter sp. H39-3-26]MDF1485638.1 acyl-CoA/acyl-ACP dehydrogenase [Ramlibacter sp. H39-3-26]